ncbi:MAG TPA: Maf family protein, partial [Stellaceae bacterium]|nr:Maf family protein [Stellaceae bacterium]
MSLAPGDPLVLASGSATRARLLADCGLPILVDPAAVDEEEIRASFLAEGRDAAACATALAEAKATRVSARHAGALVLGADQILECGGRWLEKPRDTDAARAQLRLLRGKRHTLVTA